MKFGLEQPIIDKLIAVFEQHSKVDKALVFGSRAKGNYRPDSDIDIALKGQDLNTDDSIAMSVAFEEKGITHKIDLINYDTIKEPDLKDHIDRVGIELYSRWKEYSLGEISNKITDGAHLSPKDSINGKIMFSVKDMIDNGFDYTKPKTISQEDFVALEKQGCKPEIDDILIAKDGSVLKHIFRVVNEPDYVLLSSIAIVKPKKEIVDPSFLVYTLKNPKITDTILTNFVSGSGVPRIVLKDFKKVDVSVPPLSEQTAIAYILGSLDDKIDLLHRQNKTLEQLAETLFRQWFVEEAEESITLGELAKVSTGKGLKRNEFVENGIYPILGANGEIGRTNNYLTEEKLILTGRVGTLGEVKISSEKVWISDNVLMINPNENKFFYPIYFSLSRIDFENMNVGSTQPLVTQTDLKKIELKLPNDINIERFAEDCNLYFNKIDKNKQQIRTLTQTRDTLLPKLMSGEVRINL
jgi:type I restriction enzyme S subunit